MVGAGVFGSVLAYLLNKKNKKVLVIDSKKHIGGLCASEKIEGIDVHLYGAHIFKTDDKNIWRFVNSVEKFKQFINEPVAVYGKKVYNLPFNMNTFCKMFNVSTPEQAKIKIEKDCVRYPRIDNLEQYAKSNFGRKIYRKLIKEYTEKQWCRKCNKLPASIMSSVPLRFTFSNNYYDKEFQGIPADGWNSFFSKLLQGVDVLLEKDFYKNESYYKKIAKNIVFTGRIDEYYNFQFGRLEYRSLLFNHEIYDTDNFQGNAVVNYTSKKVPYTRTIEHKHFLNTKSQRTIVTKEFPAPFIEGQTEPYYPINTKENQALYMRYYELSKKEKNIFFCGRLGRYKYDDIAKCVKEAIDFSKEILSEK